MAVNKFNGVCIVTQDVARMRSFYESVLGVETTGDDTFAVISTKGAALSLFTEEGMERMAPGSTQGAGRGSYTLEFEVSDVDEEYARLTNLGATIVKPPTTQAWGRRSVWFRDPDGNIINFYANVPYTGG
jgi:catechol 2,3-dioxygenase-like lactoylglutathione lyase family enzyme